VYSVICTIICMILYDVSCLKLSHPRRLALVSANFIAKWPSMKSGQFKVTSMQYLHMECDGACPQFCGEIYHLKYFQFGGNSNSSTANIQVRWSISSTVHRVVPGGHMPMTPRVWEHVKFCPNRCWQSCQPEVPFRG